jgi:hypothetical protein
MGTDIHMACEIRLGDKWHLVTNSVFKNSWYRPNSQYSWEQQQFTNIPYDNRCYNLFAILADVRNGYGFAGIKIGDEFNPISAPKGYPDDMCDELISDIDGTRNYDDEDNRPHLSNEHSASWLTLQELLDYDWEQLHCDYGCVTESVYRDFIMKGERPDSWSGDVYGQDIVHLTESEMIDLINGKFPKEDTKRYYTKCYFKAETYKDASGGFYYDVIPVLKTLVPDGGTADDVRLVFDFDS